MESNCDILNDLLALKSADDISKALSCSSDSIKTSDISLNSAERSVESKNNEKDTNQTAYNNLNTLTLVSNELYSLMQKNVLEITQLDNNCSESDPRKDSPIPATPPNNIPIGSNLEEKSSNTKYTDSYVSEKLIKHSNANKQLFQPVEFACDTSINNITQNTLKQSQSDKQNLKVSYNLDKWLKEFKGHVMVNISNLI